MSKELSVIERVSSEKFKNHITKVMPKGFEVDRHMATAVEQIRSLKGGNLAPMSILNAVYNASSMGLSFNPNSKEAYLVPFGSVATLIIGYKGLMKLCKNAGMKNMTSKVIYSEDHLEYEEEDGVVSYTYSPSFNENKGKPMCVLTVAFMQDGEKDVKVLPYYKVLKTKNEAKSKGIWTKYEEEMAQKTAIRRHCAQLPQSLDDQNLQTAIRIDEMFEANKPVTENNTDISDMELEGENYQEQVDEINNQEERQSTKPKVSQPKVQEVDFEEVKTPNMDKLIEITGQSLEEIAVVLENEFKITDIESVTAKKMNSIVDVFMGKE